MGQKKGGTPTPSCTAEATSPAATSSCFIKPRPTSQAHSQQFVKTAVRQCLTVDLILDPRVGEEGENRFEAARKAWVVIQLVHHRRSAALLVVAVGTCGGPAEDPVPSSITMPGGPARAAIRTHPSVRPARPRMRAHAWSLPTRLVARIGASSQHARCRFVRACVRDRPCLGPRTQDRGSSRA